MKILAQQPGYLKFRSFTKWSLILSGHAAYATQTSTYYDILNVTPEATPQEIKSSYYELCKKYHPDTANGGDKPTSNPTKHPDISDASAVEFLKIGEAYSILSNKNTREEYDRKIGLFDDQPTSTQEYVRKRTEKDIERDLKSYEDFRTGWRRPPDKPNQRWAKVWICNTSLNRNQ